MKNKKRSILALSSVAIILSACATKPEPVAQLPPPVPVERAQAKIAAPLPAPAPENYNGEDAIAVTGSTIMDGPIPGSTEDFSKNVGDRVFFGYNEYTLSPRAVTVLRSQSQWLQAYPSAIVVIGGHADERGTRDYNLALGERRANAAKNYLVSLGVPAGRIQTVSYGKERPAATGSNEQAWAQNRRAVSVVIS